MPTVPNDAAMSHAMWYAGCIAAQRPCDEIAPPANAVLIGILAAPAQALAQSCANLYDTGDPIPLDIYEGRPTDRLPTPDLSAVTSRDNDITLYGSDPVGSCASGANWCSEARVIVPDGAYESPLFLFLHGAGDRADEHEHVLYTAAYAGMRAIGLPWDGFSGAVGIFNTETLTRSKVCRDLVDHDGDGSTGDIVSWAACGDTCDYDMATELLTGVEVDDAISPYDAHPMRSITHRTAMVLNDLYLEDMNSDAANDYEWDEFCSVTSGETTIEWSDVIVGGFSMGGTMATFISYTEGAHGHLNIDGGTDFCTDTSTGELDPSDYVATYTPCGSSCDNAVGFWHANSPPGSVVTTTETQHLLPYAGFTYDDSGGTDAPVDIDCFLDDTPPCDTSTMPYGFGPTTPNVMMTSQRPVPGGGGPHTSMAHDADMPTEFQEFGSTGPDPDPAVVGTETPILHLFPAYLEAMCSLL